MHRFNRMHGYLEQAILGNLNNPLQEATIEMMLRQIAGNHTTCDYEKAILGFGFLDAGRFHVSLDKEIICNNTACFSWAQKLADKFQLSSNNLMVTHTTKAHANLQRATAVGHERLAMSESYGTLAGFISPRNHSDDYRIFSNNHVLGLGGNSGDRVYLLDGQPTNIGELEEFVTIYSDAPNRLDLAVARLDGYAPVDTPVYSTNRAALRIERVTKFGATTGLTHGRVVSSKYNVVVHYDGSPAYFQNQLMIVSEVDGVPFSKGGDSGSLISSYAGEFLGLLFAGNGQQTYANHSADVMQQLTKWGYV